MDLNHGGTQHGKRIQTEIENSKRLLEALEQRILNALAKLSSSTTPTKEIGPP
jgi:hypothetical protein